MTDRARRDLAAAVYAAETDIDAASREIAAALRASVERHAVETPDGQRITPLARLAILEDVDAALDILYPRDRGEQGPLSELITKRANDARRVAIGRTVGAIEAELTGEPELLTAMEDA